MDWKMRLVSKLCYMEKYAVSQNGDPLRDADGWMIKAGKLGLYYSEFYFLPFIGLSIIQGPVKRIKKAS